MLAPHGSICVELGDTYSGSGGGGGDYLEGGMREGQQQFAGSAATMRESNAAHWRAKNQRRDAWPLAKSLCGIPHLYHLSLAYGRNLLTGEESPAGQWRVRNVVAWCRPNPPVGALGDKFRPATSYMTIACPSGSRYFDLDAVRTPSPRTDNKRATSTPTQYHAPGQPERKTRASTEDAARLHANAAGAPPLDYWVIPTQPYSGSHYAVYPPALCERPIKSMAPLKVCTVCGEPSRRIVEVDGLRGKDMLAAGGAKNDRGDGLAGARAPMHDITRTTVGWSDCGCDGGEARWRPGVVLDPFAGSGTTLSVATGHGRDAIGIDIDHRNVALARDRVGPLFFTEEWLGY